MLILSVSPLLTISFGYFLFQIANISSTAIISVDFNSESIITRQGTQVSPIAPVTFLYGTYVSHQENPVYICMIIYIYIFFYTLLFCES